MRLGSKAIFHLEGTFRAPFTNWCVVHNVVRFLVGLACAYLYCTDNLTSLVIIIGTNGPSYALLPFSFRAS